MRYFEKQALSRDLMQRASSKGYDTAFKLLQKGKITESMKKSRQAMFISDKDFTIGRKEIKTKLENLLKKSALTVPLSSFKFLKGSPVISPKNVKIGLTAGLPKEAIETFKSIKLKPSKTDGSTLQLNQL